MQFYVIHEDPETNAKLLPDYCLKRVNVREGWQMLSDIGHLYGVTWEGQNKEYNKFHPNTMRWWKNKNSFKSFLNYYVACLQEYYIRFDKTTSFHDKYFTHEHKIKNIPIIDLTDYEIHQIYLLMRKNKHLKDADIFKLLMLVDTKKLKELDH